MMNNRHFLFVFLCLAIFLPLQGRASTVLLGDYEISTGNGQPGDLSVDGNFHLNGSLDFGTTVETTPRSAVSLGYGESGSAYTSSLSATRDNVSFLWRENAGGTLQTKMKLDADNILRLYDGSGNVGLTLSPASGITLPSGRSLTLSDGTTLSGAASLRSSALYDASGNARLSFDSNGSLVLSSPLKLEGAGAGIDFGGGNTLNESGVVNLKQALANLGYGDYAINLPISKVVVDASGNAYVAGAINGSLAVGGMTLNSAEGNVFVAKIDSGGAVKWAKNFSGGGMSGIAVDANGNVYVTGSFEGSLSSGLPQTLTSLGGYDAYVVKFTNGGDIQWAKRFGGSIDDGSAGIAADSAGNVYVTGSFAGSLTGGVSPALTSTGSFDAYVLKLNGAGTLQWAKKFGGTDYDAALGVSCDLAGNVYLLGSYAGSMSSGLPQPLTAVGADAFLLKLNGGGAVQWARSYGATEGGNFYMAGMALDGDGNVSLAGTIYGTLDVGLPQPLTGSWSAYDAFVIRVNAQGGVQWAKRFASYESYPTGVASDDNGNTYLAGYFYEYMDVGAFGFSTIDYPQDGFLIKLDSAGSILLAKSIGTTGSDLLYGVSVAKNGSAVALVGYTQNGHEIGNQTVNSDYYSYLYLTREDFGSSPVLGRTPSFSWGNSRASAEGAVALGSKASAASLGSVALGGGFSSGQYSFSGGEDTSASAEASTALGYATHADGQSSTAFGNSTRASGEVSTAFGLGTQASSYASVALGRYNVGLGTGASWIGNDSLLEIGNGENGGNRSNALTLFKNAKLRTGGVIEAKDGFRTPPKGDLSMGSFTAGQNPADLDPALGLKYQGE